MSDQDRNEILEKLSDGLGVGFEMIKSVVHFVIDKMKDLLTSKNFAEIKSYISQAAEKFGKTLYDVTKKLVDKVVDTIDRVKGTTVVVIGKTTDCVSDACHAMKEQGGKAVNRLRTNNLTQNF